MTRNEFDVKTREGAVTFLRSMYNFKDVARDADAKWNRGKEGLCHDLYDAVKPLDSLTSRTASQRSGSSAALPSINRHVDRLRGQGLKIHQYSTLVCAF